MSSIIIPVLGAHIESLAATSNRPEDKTIPVAAHLLEEPLLEAAGSLLVDLGLYTYELDPSQSFYVPQRRTAQIIFDEPSSVHLAISEWKAQPERNLPLRTSVQIRTVWGRYRPFPDLTGSCVRLLRNIIGRPVDFKPDMGKPLGVLFRADSYYQLNDLTNNILPPGLVLALAKAASLTHQHPYYGS